ncbi:MAG: 4-hydroxy-tetrahydrodipicolinate reductase [Vallitaleaceae bacterium]|nr:4-hydroxy-tetrahydrodipicolinate reductase [Vallitaleaceae bacterium]
MIKIIMHGCNGKMGQVISGLVAKDSKAELVAGIDPYTGLNNPYPVFPSADSCSIDADVIIDFSTAKAVKPLLQFAKSKSIPVVVCTTGLNEEEISEIKSASQDIPILFSANMSLGVNLLMNLARKATAILTEAGFDIEIIEKHHNQKIDAPSGTAIAIANVINEELDNSYEYKYDRSGERKKRETNEIGIHALRGGTIVGEHSIVFAGRDEVVELKHSALSKEIFAVGAVNAAKFLAGKSAGMYDMSDVINH